jgi:hypothetical protein
MTRSRVSEEIANFWDSAHLLAAAYIPSKERSVWGSSNQLLLSGSEEQSPDRCCLVIVNPKRFPLGQIPEIY